MDAQLLMAYADYNHWANRRMAQTLTACPAEWLTKEVASSFPSIIATVEHVWGAEQIWYHRLKGTSLSGFPKNRHEKRMEVMHDWVAFSAQFAGWLAQQPEAFFSSQITYGNTMGKTFTQPAAGMLLHCFNHSSYHRGQLTTLLRGLGWREAIPQMDYIAYMRTKNP